MGDCKSVIDRGGRNDKPDAAKITGGSIQSGAEIQRRRIPDS